MEQQSQGLHVQSEKAAFLASEHAALTGTSVASAVTDALRPRLEEDRRKRDRNERIDRILDIASDIRAHMRHPLPTSDHSDLYDENGLPA